MGDARTRTIVRRTPRRAADAGRSRLGDLTRPIAKEQRIAKNRRPALLLGAVGVIVAGAIAAALFVLPVRTWFDHPHRVEAFRADLQTLQTAHDQLQQEVDELQTGDGVRAAARAEI